MAWRGGRGGHCEGQQPVPRFLLRVARRAGVLARAARDTRALARCCSCRDVRWCVEGARRAAGALGGARGARWALEQARSAWCLAYNTQERHARWGRSALTCVPRSRKRSLKRGAYGIPGRQGRFEAWDERGAAVKSEVALQCKGQHRFWRGIAPQQQGAWRRRASGRTPETNGDC